jgi:clathrin heavy chain
MYEESLALSKADRLWRDALETAASSKEIAVAEELAGYFVSIGNKDAFAAILYVCFELVRPDFVEEMVRRVLVGLNIEPALISSRGDSALVIIRNPMFFSCSVIRRRE